MKTAKKQAPNQPKIDAWERAGETTGRVILAILMVPVLILKGLYASMFRIPGRPSHMLGALRMLLMFIFIYALGEMESAGGFRVHIIDFLSNNVFSSEETAKASMTFLGSIFSINFIASIFVMLGMNTNDRRYGTGSHSTSSNSVYPYGNIEDALKYREAVVSQNSLPGKVEEYAKTAFVNKDTFLSMSSNGQNMKDSVQYLNSLLGQYSQSGKYKLLKELFSGK